jgi:hypothetical protein
MQSSPAILFAVLCIFALMIFGMIGVVVFSARKSAEHKNKIARALGLTIASNTTDLLEKVLRINGHPNTGRYLFRDIFHRHHTQGGDVYFFDLVSHGTSRMGNGKRKNSFNTAEASVLAFISPEWKLPFFKIFPRLDGGKPAEVANKVAEAALDIKFDLIKFPHIPKLDELYLISTSESSASQIQPPDGFLRVLAAHSGLNIHVGGDTMTLSYYDTSTSPNEEKMMALYKIGLQMARELQSR